MSPHTLTTLYSACMISLKWSVLCYFANNRDYNHVVYIYIYICIYIYYIYISYVGAAHTTVDTDWNNGKNNLDVHTGPYRTFLVTAFRLKVKHWWISIIYLAVSDLQMDCSDLNKMIQWQRSPGGMPIGSESVAVCYVMRFHAFQWQLF